MLFSDLGVSRFFLLLALLACGGQFAPGAFAHHGPGTTGGAVSTQSGETLNPGQLAFQLTWNYTQFESLDNEDIKRRTAEVKGGDPDFDALRWSLLQAAELSYGVLEDFQLSLAIGWYRADDLKEGRLNGGGEPEVLEAVDVSGLTDPWIGGKYRVLKEPYGHWALSGGIKLPLGRDDVRADGEAERLEPSLQPGSGAFDFSFGTAYSAWLTSRMTLDASAQYTLRTENDAFKIGDRVEGGAALGYRLFEDNSIYPQASLFLEANAIHLFQNEETGHRIENSGGTFLFLAPGARLGITKNFSFSLAPQFPVLQALNDEQERTLFKVVMAVTVSL